MSASPSTKHPIVFVHGLWLHAESWKPWIEFFRQNGYEASAASWPGDSETTEATRQKRIVAALTDLAPNMLEPT